MSNNTRKIAPIREASITTMTVELQVIRIGAKQMTLSVFRQLPFEDIFNREGNLIAPPWGWVNYEWDGRRRPFVFSYEGVLYRSLVHLEYWDDDLCVKADTYEEDIPAHRDPDGLGWIYGKKELKITGDWIIRSGRTRIGYGDRLVFHSKAGARIHLQNRMRSAETLRAAPQLYIGV